MSVYYPDSISWTLITKTEIGEESGSPVTISCRIEDTNKIISGGNGQSIKARALIFASAKNAIKKGDIIKLLSIRGDTPPDTAQEYQVREIMSNKGFTIGEWEIYI